MIKNNLKQDLTFAIIVGTSKTVTLPNGAETYAPGTPAPRRSRPSWTAS
jgi:hypothetical protein